MGGRNDKQDDDVKCVRMKKRNNKNNKTHSQHPTSALKLIAREALRADQRERGVHYERGVFSAHGVEPPAVWRGPQRSVSAALL